MVGGRALVGGLTSNVGGLIELISGNGPMTDQHRSEAIKLGLAKAKANGKKLGTPGNLSSEARRDPLTPPRARLAPLPSAR